MMTMRRLSIYFVLSLQLLQLVSLVQAQYSAKRRKDGNPLARSVRVINESGVRVDVFWMNPDTGLLADSNTNQEGIVYGGESGLASYVGHAFEIQELPSSSSKQCQRKLCRKAYFTVNANEDQWVTIDKEFGVTMQDSQSRALQLAKEALHECRQWSRSESQSGNHHSDRTMEALAECLLRKAETVLNETVEEIHFQARVRKDLGARLSQYSCSDDMFTAGVQVTTTPSILNETYSGGQPVRTLFESSDGAERIRLYEDFVTEEECQNVFRTRQIPDTMASKVHDLVTSTAAAPAVGVNPNEIFTELKLETSMDIAATTKETTVTTTETTDCPVQDGAESCSSSSRSRSDSSSIGSGSENTPKKQVLVTTTEENVVARLIVTCLATAETTETKTTTTSGMLYFPKTGTRILPTHLSAVLIQYRSNRNSRPQRQRLEEEVDWYLDQHTVCPVTEEGVTVATLETINSSP